jgi:RimJ/RimL family protein N-acetyltransferase
MADRSSSEREYALLVAQLGALDEDIAAAHAAAWRAEHPPRMDFHSAHGAPSAPSGERVRLSDGAEIVLRPVEPGDRHEIELGFEHLSALSRMRSLRRPVKRLTARELAELTDVDHETNEGMVALDATSGQCVGGARFARRPEDPAQADFTCTVADEWQRRGVGTALVERLAARAHAVGIERFNAVILVGDEAARRLLRRVAVEVGEHRAGGVIGITGEPREQEP